MIERKYIFSEFGGPIVFEMLIPRFESGMDTVSARLRGDRKKTTAIRTKMTAENSEKPRSPIYSRPRKEWE